MITSEESVVGENQLGKFWGVFIQPTKKLDGSEKECTERETIHYMHIIIIPRSEMYY